MNKQHSKKNSVKAKQWASLETKDRVKTILLSFFPALIMMGLIFYFSACPGTESSETSSKVVYFLIAIIKKIPFISLSSSETMDLALQMSYPVRKLAHISEYAVLSWCFFWGIYNLVHWFPYIPAFFCTFFYACTDEVHQLSVAGRSGKVTDVCIDSFGAFVALLILCGIIHLYMKHKNRREDIQNGTKSE